MTKEQKELQKEVNRGVREPLDRTVFKKTAKDKQLLWELKSKWKSLMKECFPNPIERKKYNNPICK